MFNQMFDNPVVARNSPRTTVNNKELNVKLLLPQQPQPAVAPVKRKEHEQPGRVVFTLKSPERVNTKELDEGFGVFLQACYLCKKKLKQDMDIYMYGHLGAFCSPDCRDDGIALDRMYTEEVDTMSITMVPSRRL